MIVDPVIYSPHSKLGEIIKALQRRLTLKDNIATAIIDVADTGTANVTFTVNHRLGYIPTTYIWNIDRAGTVYDFSRATWTSTQMTLRCSVANAVLKLVVF